MRRASAAGACLASTGSAAAALAAAAAASVMAACWAPLRAGAGLSACGRGAREGSRRPSGALELESGSCKRAGGSRRHPGTADATLKPARRARNAQNGAGRRMGSQLGAPARCDPRGVPPARVGRFRRLLTTYRDHIQPRSGPGVDPASSKSPGSKPSFPASQRSSDEFVAAAADRKSGQGTGRAPGRPRRRASPGRRRRRRGRPLEPPRRAARAPAEPHRARPRPQRDGVHAAARHGTGAWIRAHRPRCRRGGLPGGPGRRRAAAPRGSPERPRNHGAGAWVAAEGQAGVCGGSGRRRRARVGARHARFCPLCWRPCTRAVPPAAAASRRCQPRMTHHSRGARSDDFTSPAGSAGHLLLDRRARGGGRLRAGHAPRRRAARGGRRRAPALPGASAPLAAPLAGERAAEPLPAAQRRPLP